MMCSQPYSRYLRPAMTGAHTTVQPYPCPPGVLTEHPRLGMASVTPPGRAVAWSRPCRGLIKLRFEPTTPCRCHRWVLIKCLPKAHTSKASLPTCCQEMVEHLDARRLEELHQPLRGILGPQGSPSWLSVVGRVSLAMPLSESHTTDCSLSLLKL